MLCRSRSRECWRPLRAESDQYPRLDVSARRCWILSSRGAHDRARQLALVRLCLRSKLVLGTLEGLSRVGAVVRRAHQRLEPRRHRPANPAKCPGLMPDRGASIGLGDGRHKAKLPGVGLQPLDGLVVGIVIRGRWMARIIRHPHDRAEPRLGGNRSWRRRWRRNSRWSLRGHVRWEPWRSRFRRRHGRGGVDVTVAGAGGGTSILHGARNAVGRIFAAVLSFGGWRPLTTQTGKPAAAAACCSASRSGTAS